MEKVILGLDIGTNSVGSAWIDLENHEIYLGCSVFPAGVEESDQKRGAPKNQARRTFRQRRRNIDRKADRKTSLYRFLKTLGWIPTEEDQIKNWLQMNPWLLRRDGLVRELTPCEFGRILLHMIQRRGASWVQCDTSVAMDDDVSASAAKENKEKDKENEKKIKGAIQKTKDEMKKKGVETFGQFMAEKYLERRKKIDGKNKYFHLPIRNRKTAAGEGTYEYCADRAMIWQEFDKLWKKQKAYHGKLASQLTDECRRVLDNPEGNDTWIYQGILFGQRRFYWDLGTLGRCDLEPTDMKCPKADMNAQEYLVLESLNNIRIIPAGETERKLTTEERASLLNLLRTTKSVTVSSIRKALKINTDEKKKRYSLNIENDKERSLNTDWFYRTIVLNAIGESVWKSMPQEQKDSINRAILKFDPEDVRDREKLTKGCQEWWGFSNEQTDKFLSAWSSRPSLDKRVNFSRRALRNLLPYMREGYSVNEARKLFAEDASNNASKEQRKRYGFDEIPINRSLRKYLRKHPDLIPPAPQEISNPVVRKTIHEVRRHIIAYLRKFRRKPDRIVIELAREARQTAVVRNKKLAQIRSQEKVRKQIIEQYNLETLNKNQQKKAVMRVLLCREQKGICPYSNLDSAQTLIIDESNAAKSLGVEIDHIIPQSRGGDSSLNNLVLCIDDSNRGKGNQTPKEWLTEDQFGRLEQRMEHLKKSNPIKWENLHKSVSDLDGFVKSQLVDTAYASRQVANWLKGALYGEQQDGARRVFTTKGVYTAILRKDWQLFLDGSDAMGWEKDRSDHRHHALDAIAIAFSGPERIRQIAQIAEEREMARAEGRKGDKRQPLAPPWGTHESFRRQVMEKVEKLVVAHRPEGRKLRGHLHKDNPYGPVIDKEKNEVVHATIRKVVAEISIQHLRVPDGWEELRLRLEEAPTKLLKKEIRRKMLALEDVKPGKPGVIRDRWFREELRSYLRENQIDPDHFDEKQIKELVKQKGIVLKRGVPVRRITLLRSPTLIMIPRKQRDAASGERRNCSDADIKSFRFYEPRNNHHIEIRRNQKGKWVGEVVTNFEAVKRVRSKLPTPNVQARVPSAVNRADTEWGEFVMSLSIGEMVFMMHPVDKKPGYFVVFKIDDNGAIHFTPHYDAGRSRASEKCPAREDISLTPPQLQCLGVGPDSEPQKVWVSPLGDVKFLIRD